MRNIELNRYNKIGRKLGGALYLKETTSVMLDSTFDDFFNSSLFQFIQDGEEYSIEELLKGG